MSSVALVPWSLERSESIPPRRAFLSVCPPASAAETSAAHASVAFSLAAEPARGEPSAPSVALLHAASAAPASEPASSGVALRSEPSHGADAPPAVTPAAAGSSRLSPAQRGRVDGDTELGHEALIAMLPSLERRAYRWCRDPAEAQDLAQDTVLRALGNGPAFDSEGHLRAWLYTVLRNLFISRRRRDQSWQRACGELNGLAQATPPAPPPVAFLTPSIERAIARLPEAFARVVRLVDLEDYSYADAASTLGVPVGTVMSRLFRARQRLAQDLPLLV
jgi:RNA polymerase sigma-70 factor (ECF subfamily)